MQQQDIHVVMALFRHHAFGLTSQSARLESDKHAPVGTTAQCRRAGGRIMALRDRPRLVGLHGFTAQEFVSKR